MFAVCGNIVGELPYSDMYDYKVLCDERGIRLFLKSVAKTNGNAKYTKIFVQQEYMISESDAVKVRTSRIYPFTDMEDLKKQLSEIFADDNKLMQGADSADDIDGIVADGTGLRFNAVVDMMELSTLKQQNKQLESELETANISVEGLQGVISEAHAEIGRLNSDYAKLEAEKADLVEMYNKVIHERDEQQAENNQNVNEFDSLSNDYNNLVESNEKLDAEYKKLLEEYDTRTSEFKEAYGALDTKCQELQATVVALQTKVDALNVDNNKLQGVITELNAQLTELQTQVAESKRQNAEQERIIQALKEQVGGGDNTKVLYDNLKVEYNRVNVELENANAMYQGVVSECEAERVKNSELNKKLGDVEMKNQELTTELAKVRGASGVSMVQFNELQLKYNQLREQGVTQEAEYRNKVAKLNSELTEMINQKSNLESRLASSRGNVMQSLLGKFDMYANDPIAVPSDKLSEAEMKELRGVDLSNISVCTFAGGDSFAQFITDLSKVANNVMHKCLIVDYSNDYGLFSFLGRDDRKRVNGINMLNVDNIRPEFLAPIGSNVLSLVSSKFNDIALLTVNWGMVLARIARIAQGAHVCIVLGPVTSFAVRSTFVKLASVCRGHMFSDGRALILCDTLTMVRQLYNVANFLLVVTKMSESAGKIVNSMQSFVQVKVLPGLIDFEGLGLL